MREGAGAPGQEATMGQVNRGKKNKRFYQTSWLGRCNVAAVAGLTSLHCLLSCVAHKLVWLQVIFCFS